jgi:hypothetical protein
MIDQDLTNRHPERNRETSGLSIEKLSTYSHELGVAIPANNFDELQRLFEYYGGLSERSRSTNASNHQFIDGMINNIRSVMQNPRNDCWNRYYVNYDRYNDRDSSDSGLPLNFFM